MVEMITKVYNFSKGFTLVEVLVTLMISLVLISGIISVLMSSKQSYLRKENTSQMQENLRVVADLLRKELSMAESVQQGSNEDGIIVTYRGGDGVFNCLGHPVPSGNVVSYFHVKKNTLYCSSLHPVAPESKQPLVEGITAMRIQYGVDSDEDGQVDGYTGSPGDWNTVVSARIVLRLLDSASRQQPEVTLTVAMRPRIFSRLKGDCQ
ncbi:MAG TPA: prepilin-type N-terminal cleavage/methylation domain-containing protein [Xanthomonadaceae bacterium]|nr:prepilin-type N-terminal cleavage/methylation domain-containing protein [Xanthomonadaceae bacterium]